MKFYKCRTCGKRLSEKKFGKSKGNKYGLNYHCKLCAARKNREWKKANRDAVKLSNMRGMDKQLAKALKIYGGKCEQCGISDGMVLVFHHRLGNDGSEDSSDVARKINKSGVRTKEYALVCQNCHVRMDNLDGTHRRGRRMLRASLVMKGVNPKKIYNKKYHQYI